MKNLNIPVMFGKPKTLIPQILCITNIPNLFEKLCCCYFIVKYVN